MNDPVMRSEAELQRAHDLLGIGVRLRLMPYEQHNLACDYGAALCWALGHEHEEGPSEFEKFLRDVQKLVDGFGYSALLEVKENGGVS